MNYRKSIETTAELGAWYDAKYIEMKGGWNTPAEECNRHLDDLGVPFDNTKALLDVGCGAGHFLAEAVKRVSCLGIEISEEGARLTKSRVPSAVVVCAGIESGVVGPDEIDTFDYICSIGSLEHILDLDAALDRICDLLKPDGRFYFYCPNENWHYEDQPNERTMTDGEWIGLFRKHGLYTLKATRWGSAQDNTAFIGCKEPAAKEVEIGRRWGSPLCLNLGSGQRPFKPPFVNIDVQAKWNPDIVHDVSSLPMFEDSSVDMVVLHHVLEHFGCGEGSGVVKEAYRVLKPGCPLLVFVPDIRELAIRWLRGEMSDQLFFTNVYGAFLGDDADRHKWGFTKRSLIASLMQCAPWQKVRAFDWRDVPGADIARDWWILPIEVCK